MSVSNLSCHSGFHMIQVVTVEEPHPRVFCNEINRNLSHMAWDDDRIFQYVTNPEVVSMEVHWMPHRAPIQHPEPNVLAFLDIDRITIRIRLPVDRPFVSAPTHMSTRER